MNAINGDAYEFVPNPEDVPEGMSFKKGAHKHGYVITLTDAEQTVLKNAGYKLVTNFFYSRGDFFEVLSPSGAVVDPYALQEALISLGASHGAWMTAMAGKIGGEPLWHLLLPGTHNSGAYSLWNTTGCRCQALDIRGQLLAGARVLDLRVLRRPDGVYALHHSGHHVAGEEQTLAKALGQIRDFADKYPGEVIVVQLQQGHLEKMYSKLALNAADHEAIRVMIGGSIGGRMAGPAEGVIVGQMTARGHNILVMCPTAAMVDAVARWDPAILYDSWTDEQSSWGSGSIGYKLGEIEKNIGNALSGGTSEYIYASCMAGSANVLGHAPEVNRKICGLLDTYSGVSSAGKRISVAAVDYIETPDNAVMGTIIEVNKRRFP